MRAVFLVLSTITCGACIWGGHPFLAFCALCCAGFWVMDIIENF